MALIKCRECGEEISSFASSCPNCGCPMEICMQGDADYFSDVNVNGKEFCPVCSQEINPFYGNKSYTDDNGKRHTEYLCKFCRSWVTPLSSLKNFQEVLNNPLFNHDKYEQSLSMALRNKSINDNKNDLLPKCPTCGSTNIEKISTLSKATGAYMFGLLSKTARSQFKCKNCGYKW